MPGYRDLLRLQVLSGNDQHLELGDGLVQIEGMPARKDLVLPSGDNLFTSGTLGHYSAMLNDLQENESRKSLGLNQVAAD